MTTRNFPFWTRLEGSLAKWPLMPFFIKFWHRVRKKLHVLKWRAMKKKWPTSLRNFEKKVHSQNGEDGIVEEIFRRIGTTNKTVVEFGVEDGYECNARYLVESLGWNAILLDGWDEGVRKARELYSGKPVRVAESFITAENIVELFRANGVPKEADLVVVDIDSNDYWVLQSILKEFRPRVLLLEYNARFTPPTRWIMPYNPTYVWDRSAFCGASLQAFADLGKEHGYSVVGCDYQGVNTFLVRNDLLGEHFPDVNEPLSYHYQAPLYTYWYGHPVNPPPPKKPARGLSPAGVALDANAK
jgi:hypothetical protein